MSKIKIIAKEKSKEISAHGNLYFGEPLKISTVSKVGNIKYKWALPKTNFPFYNTEIELYIPITESYTYYISEHLCKVANTKQEDIE